MWVQCHHPALLGEAIQMTEDELAVYLGVGEPSSSLYKYLWMDTAVVKHEVEGIQHWLGRYCLGRQCQFCLRKAWRLARDLPPRPSGKFHLGVSLKQTHDENLRHVFDQVQVIDGQ